MTCRGRRRRGEAAYPWLGWRLCYPYPSCWRVPRQSHFFIFSLLNFCIFSCAQACL